MKEAVCVSGKALGGVPPGGSLIPKPQHISLFSTMFFLYVLISMSTTQRAFHVGVMTFRHRVVCGRQTGYLHYQTVLSLFEANSCDPNQYLINRHIFNTLVSKMFSKDKYFCR